MASKDLKQKCEGSLAKIVECLRNFCEIIKKASVHVTTIARESSNVQFIQSYNNEKLDFLQKMPDTKLDLLEKIEDKIHAAFLDLESVMKFELKVFRKNIEVECANIMDSIRNAPLSSKELSCPAFGPDGTDSFADVYEDVHTLKRLIADEYFWRKCEILVAHDDWTQISETVSRWEDTKALMDIQKDLETYITT